MKYSNNNNSLRMSESELFDYGKKLADSLHPGSVVALSGDLGVGKTTLTKAIAAGLGVTDDVSSPTFTLINEYGGGRLPLYHFDVYRLGEDGGEDIYAAMDQLGWEDYFYGNGVCVVEWADMIEDIIPSDAIRIYMAHTEFPDVRMVEITFGNGKEKG